uniref:HD domain-containing protein n=1 Tax=Oryza rufipogon TaxID=4529 RepID=A0A0E0R0L5_ORYRU
MIARNAAAAAAAVFFLFCLLAFPSAPNSNTLGAPAADWGWICAGRRRPLVGNGERLGLHASSSTAGCGPVRSGAMALDNAEDMSIVERFLEEVELEQGQREEIVAIIKGMGFKNEVSKKSVVEPTLEFAIVQDADRLDAIGAIGKYCITEVSLSALLKQSFLQQLGCSKCCTGYAKSFPCTILFFPLLPLDSDGINLSSIARCFTYGGSKKNTLHDPKILPRDNLSKEKYMSKDEKQTSINHFHEKLFKLKDMMKTEAGKKRAEKRHKFMEDFVAEFYEEWSGRA